MAPGRYGRAPQRARAWGPQCLLWRRQKCALSNGSTLRLAVEARSGQSVMFPALADRVSDDLDSQRLSSAGAFKTQPLGNRAELTRWRMVVTTVLAGVTQA